MATDLQWLMSGVEEAQVPSAWHAHLAWPVAPIGHVCTATVPRRVLSHCSRRDVVGGQMRAAKRSTDGAEAAGGAGLVKSPSDEGGVVMGTLEKSRKLEINGFW